MERLVHGVFAGGGIKGIALAGAAAGAMDSGYRFEQVVGTSSGSLVGSLIAAGYTSDELANAVMVVPWPDLADPMPAARFPGIGRHLALAVGLGHNRGDKIERVWRSLLKEKGVKTFSDLPTGSLRMVSTDLTHQRGVVLPDQLGEYGAQPDRFSVARAVRMSCAVPFFFRPVQLRNLRTSEVSLFADGALTANFPLRVAPWDEDHDVVGFKFVDADMPRAAKTIKGPVSLVRAVVEASVRASGTLRGSLMEKAMMVEIPAERDPLDFDISPVIASHLFEVGRKAAVDYFDLVEETEALSHFRKAKPGALGHG